MADFTQINEEINADINTNGANEITGAKLNQVLRDMIAAVNTAKQDPLTIDATPTEDSTNPVQSGGVYYEMQNKPTIYYTQDITSIPPTILSRLKAGDFVKYGEGNEVIAIVAGIVDGSTFLYSSNGIAVDAWMYSNGDVEHYQFDLRDFALRSSNPTAGHLAELDTFGDLADSGIAAEDVVTKTQYEEAIASLQQQIDELKNQ